MAMNTSITQFIDSGLLELYVSGTTTAAETAEVEQMAAAHPEVAAALDAIAQVVQGYAQAHAVEPNPTIKPFLMATIDYTTRLQQGEPMTFPPELHAGSTIADYYEWLNRADMKAPGNIPDMHAKIIGYTPQMTTAIVWIKEMAPQEVHDNEIEKFLIVEGTCDIIIGDTVHQLKAGDVLQIPLYEHHVVKVTSMITCKVILQRVAA